MNVLRHLGIVIPALPAISKMRSAAQEDDVHGMHTMRHDHSISPVA